MSTISRECRRNQPSRNKVKYSANQAHLRSQERQEKSHIRTRLKSEATRQYVAEKLLIVWTPELIAGRIKHEGLLETTNHESIYHDPIVSAEKEAQPSTHMPPRSPIESLFQTDLF